MTVTRPYYLLKLFIDSKDNELLNLYAESSRKHNSVVERYLHGELVHVDAGIDLFCPAKLIVEGKNVGKVNHLVKTSMEFIETSGSIPVGYYLYPRSSTATKTPLRLANSVGIIDSGYRGNIIAVFDNMQNYTQGTNFTIEPYQRLVQLCSPNLTYPIYVRIVEKEEDLGITLRGAEGFGSTGK
jgi:dUTP pyrophosphatase